MQSFGQSQHYRRGGKSKSAKVRSRMEERLSLRDEDRLSPGRDYSHSKGQKADGALSSKCVMGV